MDLFSLSSLLLSGLLLASVSTWVATGVRWRRGLNWFPAVDAADVRPHWISIGLSTLSVAFSLKAAFSMGTHDPKEIGLGTVQSQCLMQALIWTALALPMLADPDSKPQHLGFHRRDWGRQFRDGAVGFLLFFWPVIALAKLTESWRPAGAQHPLLRLLASDTSLETVAWVALTAAVVAPLVEELQYRVILQTSAESVLPRRTAYALTAVLFAAVHRFPDGVALLPLAFILGCMFQRRRSYLSVVVAHALFNATNILLVWLSVPIPSS